MKKIFVIAAAACTVFASCKKEAPVAAVQNEGQQEITFSALSKAMTKGVLGSGDSFDNTKRTIKVASVVKSGDTWVDFLSVKDFAQDGTSGIWKANPKVYYPLGDAVTNFLAYSETAIPTDGTRKAITERWYGSSDVDLQVSEKCDTVDIVYAAFKGDKTATSTGVTATFKHAQALVTVAIQTKSAGQEITINSIGFEDVKTSGTLNLKLTTLGDSPVATPTWLFNAGCTCHYAEMIPYNLGEGSTIPSAAPTAAVETKFVEVDDQLPGDVTNTPVIFDKLFPAQELETKTIVINYTLGGLTADARLPFDSTNTKTWAAGTRYVYTITVNTTEITINPGTEEAWSVTALSGEYDPAS